MTVIERLWLTYELPAVDGLYFADGRAYEVSASRAERVLRINEALDVEQLLSEEPDLVACVDGLSTHELADGDVLWAGEGCYGSDGFFGRVRSDRGLVWAVFLEEADPFRTIQVSGRQATFTSTSGTVITVDIDDPSTTGTA
ncbi:hypothetical protein ACF1GS_27135 [Streptomyces eurythermus]|uniref:hypothetical protein n=1 Tax=Streptomyces eurythermus TaxID=42237 RepID=UPI0027A56906|nr:hypothetical protein J3S85_19540 [Streptomyces lavenduligriseus]